MAFDAHTGGSTSPLVQLIPFVLILLIFYFSIYRPMRMRQKQSAERQPGTGSREPAVHVGSSAWLGGVVSGALGGMIVGYFLFARINGEYVTPELYLSILFTEPRGLVMRLGSFVGAFETIRQNSLITIGIGAFVGLLGGLAVRSKTLAGEDDAVFRDALRGLQRGDFSRLEPLFDTGLGPAGNRPRIVEWFERGFFSDEPKALAEALTCACFLGRTSVADYLLTQGVDSAAGVATGLDAFHWAANRGQLETVRLLIRRKAPLETRSMHGGTVLGTAVWAAINEPRPDHLQIIKELLNAGARRENVDYPTGHEQVDAVLQRHGAS